MWLEVNLNDEKAELLQNLLEQVVENSCYFQGNLACKIGDDCIVSLKGMKDTLLEIIEELDYNRMKLN